MAENVLKNRVLAGLAALAVGKSQTEAAQLVGVSPRTLRRWAKSPRGKQILRRLQREMFQQTVGVLVESTTVAARTLRKLVEDAESESVKLAACRAVLDYDIQVRVALDVDDRLSALENAAARGQRR